MGDIVGSKYKFNYILTNMFQGKIRLFLILNICLYLALVIAKQKIEKWSASNFSLRFAPDERTNKRKTWPY